MILNSSQIREVSKKPCVGAASYIIIQGVSSPFVAQNESEAKGFFGFMIFLVAVGPVAVWTLNVIFAYCCYGSRKALKTGKVASFGVASTVASSTSSIETE